MAWFRFIVFLWCRGFLYLSIHLRMFVLGVKILFRGNPGGWLDFSGKLITNHNLVVQILDVKIEIDTFRWEVFHLWIYSDKAPDNWGFSLLLIYITFPRFPYINVLHSSYLNKSFPSLKYAFCFVDCRMVKGLPSFLPDNSMFTQKYRFLAVFSSGSPIFEPVKCIDKLSFLCRFYICIL